MNATVRFKWVEALRSGNYQQGRERLRNTSGEFCCLGVLCDLAAQDGIGTWQPSGAKDAVMFVSTEGDGSLVELPPTVARWAGLHERDPYVVTGSETSARLSTVNDTANPVRSSFAEIADMIEKSL